MSSKLTAYKIGLGVVGLLTIVLLIMVIISASTYKYDNHLNQQATNIANILNNYITNNGQIPASLSAAGIANVPSGITYTQVSNSSYRFCIDYKASQNGFSATQLETQLITSTTGNGGNPNSSYSPPTS